MRQDVNMVFIWWRHNGDSIEVGRRHERMDGDRAETDWRQDEAMIDAEMRHAGNRMGRHGDRIVDVSNPDKD